MSLKQAHSGEVSEAIEKKAPLLLLLTTAILIILSIILFSFEDLAEPIRLSDLVFDASTRSAPSDASSRLEIDWEIEAEQALGDLDS